MEPETCVEVMRGSSAIVSLLCMGRFVYRRTVISAKRIKRVDMSEVSSTDVKIFSKLANPEVVNVDLERGMVGTSGPSKREANLQKTLEAVVEEAEPQSPKQQTAGTFRQAVEAAQAAPAPPVATLASSSTSPPVLPGSPRRARPPTPFEDAETASTGKEEPEPDEASEEQGEDKLDKQGYLIELNNLQSKGVRLSRQFTMNDSLEEIQFEYDRQTSSISSRNTVSFMRDTLRLAVTGLELMNNKLGPVLSIEGWADSVTSDMTRYDHALDRIHKRYFRKTQLSPLMELAWLLGASMVTFHFKNKFFGPSRPAAQPRPAPPPPMGRQDGGTPPSYNPSAAKRAPLRPPGGGGLAGVKGVSH